MKKIMSVTLAMLFAVLCVIPAFAAGYSCNLSADKGKANVGDTVTVSVNVGAGLTGLDATVSFDTAYFELVDAKATSLMVTVVGASKPGQVHLAGATTQPTNAGSVANITLKVLQTGGQISCKVNEALDAEDNDVSSQMNSSSIRIYAGSAPATQASTTQSSQSNQGSSSSNNSSSNQGSSSSNNSSSNQGSSSNSNSSSNQASVPSANTNANATKQNGNTAPAAEITTAADTLSENTVPEVVANATEAVSENTDTLTVGATEKKSILPLIIAIAAAVISAAAIVIIILLKKREENNKEDVIGK